MDNGVSSYRRFRNEGDENGLVELIREYKDGLIFYLCGFVNDIHIAEELAEDTFVLLCVKKPKDKGEGGFKTWLYTIGRHKAIDWLRRNRKKRTVSLDDCAEISAEEQELAAAYIKEEQKRLLHHAMRRLSPSHRQVLWMVYFEDMSHKQVAAVMKKSVHSVETLVYRARISLKKQLETEGFVYEEL